MVNYALSDMITRMRNGIRVKKTKVSVISTNLTKSIADILKKEGFIESMSDSSPDSRTFDVYLKYNGKESVVTNLKTLSKPGVRIYANSNKIPQVLGGLGITILSTSKGILTDRVARELNVGGEVLCTIY